MTREEAVSIIEDRVRVTEYVGSSYVDCVDIEALKMAIEALKGKDTNVPSRKGVFIPDITVEMFRNASLEGVEDFMTSGEMEDISLPSTQQWIPCSERLPEGNMWTICQNNAGAMMIGKYNIEFGWTFPAYFDGIVAWMPLPEPYVERNEE